MSASLTIPTIQVNGSNVPGYLIQAGSPAGDWSGTPLLYVSDSSGVYTFHTSNTTNPNSAVTFNISTGVWTDVGSGSPGEFASSQTGTYSDPHTITTNGEVHFRREVSGNEYLGYINFSGWTPGSSGGFLGGTTGATGSLTQVGASINWVIDATSPSSSSSISYNLQHDGVNYYVNPIQHVNGTASGFNAANNNAPYNVPASAGTWKLWLQGTSDDELLAELVLVVSSSSPRKKVHSNFW